jgi:hypothetical protein
MNDLDRDALDSWITSPRYSEDTTTAYCHNPACKLYADEQTVDTYSEYGRTYWRNDGECQSCGHQLEETQPEEEDDV